MILGIDVGGTHTDAVCINNGEVVSTAKVETSDDLIDSIVSSVSSLNVAYENVRRVVLSTTLATNAIIENRLEKAGLIVSAGPGLNPGLLFSGPGFFLVDGAIDHRGREYIPLDEDGVRNAADHLKKNNVEALGIIAKFSVRNPRHEFRIKSIVENSFKYISMGHQMNGGLNFPRRINTTYINIGLMPVQLKFLVAVRKALARLGIASPVLFLKGDGGTFSSSATQRLPVETLLSGPAASIMGAFALTLEEKAALVMDIGGTTTDIGLLIYGVPVLEYDGISVCGLKTLIRGLKILSIGAGGDSCVDVKNGEIIIGPLRKGPPFCLGGSFPTPVDALRVLGDVSIGSLDMAYSAVEKIASKLNLGIEQTAKKIIDCMVDSIKKACTQFLNEVNSHPVYTIHEMLHPETVKPEKIVLIGGPAFALRPYIEKESGLKCHVPTNYGVANAIGAAVSKTTSQITLHADTQRRRMICPELNRDEIIPSDFTMKKLKERGEKLINEKAHYLGLMDDSEIDVLEEQSFNMVNGFRTVGRNMRLKLQTKPGILPEFRKMLYDKSKKNKG